MYMLFVFKSKYEAVLGSTSCREEDGMLLCKLPDFPNEYQTS